MASRQPGPIDLILSLDFVAKTMTHGLKRGIAPSPEAQKTLFGWILYAEVPLLNLDIDQNVTCCVTTLESIDTTLRTFFEIEDCIMISHSVKKTKSVSSGRYTVSLSFKSQNRPLFGLSRDIAVVRLHQLERRFERDAKYKQRYVESINLFCNKSIWFRQERQTHNTLSSKEKGNLL